MRRFDSAFRHLPVLLAPAGLLLALWAAERHAMAPLGLLGRSGWWVLFGLLLTLASLYRLPPPRAVEPRPEPGLRLAAFGLPALIVLYGAASAALLTGVVLLLREPLHRALARRCGRPRETSLPWLEAVAAAGAGTVVVLGSGGAWTWLSSGIVTPTADPTAFWPSAAGLFLYLVLLAGLGWTLAWFRRETPPGGLRPTVRWLTRIGLLDLFGWIPGGILARAIVGTGGDVVAPILTAFALLAFETERQRLLHRGVQRRLEEIDRVRKAGDRMVTGGGGELDRVVERIVEECANVLPWSWLQLDLVAAQTEARSWWAGHRGHLHAGTAEPPPNPPALPGMHRRAEWRVIDRALSAEGSPVARLRLWIDPRRLDNPDLELFENLLPHLAASIQRSLLDREAKRDPLTDVAARRVLEQRLQQVYREVVDHGGSMAVLMCDLDHFKRINDTFGHAAGDRVLQAAARAFEGALRGKGERDLLARYGGEEFTVLLEGANGRDALQVAERLRGAVEELELSDEETGKEIPLTVSVGVAAFPDLWIQTPTELVLLADGALYEAKRQGRNRALLDLGQGRYRDGEGNLLEAEDPPAPPEAPRVFS